MANASDLAGDSSPAPSSGAGGGGSGGGSGGGGPAALGLKLASLSLILCISLAGNVLFVLLILRDRHLHRAPYYLLLDLCLADGLRSLACFPAVLLSVRRGAGAAGGAPPPGALGCKLLAFLAVLFCFHAAFLLLGVGVTRYLAIAHHRFYAKRLTGWPCAAVVCVAWVLALAMAFPPVLDVGTYRFVREEAQCTFEHRHVGANDTLGFMLMLAAVVGATHLVYLRLLFFIYDRRKMKPAQLVPAVSQNWTFHGPGATGQAAANWTAGFGRGPTPPTLVGIRPAGPGPGGQARRLLVLEEFKTEKRLCKMFYMITLLFLLLWGPYIVACYLRVFIKAGAVPQGYLTTSVWLTFAQAGVNPILCFIFNKELRVCFRAHFPCGQSPQTTQGTLLCDLKSIGI
ncbi:putative G-protein coupled receptor 27 [Phascolarctos cinereus]|uniref:Probable G-protein coupled receptor 27 n=1 Tax=Phascolarctos cinereus TaxID=38626 RepID=A0A6P5M0P0_PHACI|nr:probable G-protein coupled receptor 27 [Phascolarctos cinereus]